MPSAKRSAQSNDPYTLPCLASASAMAVAWAFCCNGNRSRTRKRNAAGGRSFDHECFSRALPCAERNLILAFGWLNQLRNPRNRRRIGRLEIEFLDQERDAVTASLRIQRVRRLIKLQNLRFADDREIRARPLRGQEVLFRCVLQKDRGRRSMCDVLALIEPSGTC
jgi:hypothetical protein